MLVLKAVFGNTISEVLVSQAERLARIQRDQSGNELISQLRFSTNIGVKVELGATFLFCA
ncbi:hypothetical protein D3C79_955380 [compost metagenome]